MIKSPPWFAALLLAFIPHGLAQTSPVQATLDRGQWPEEVVMAPAKDSRQVQTGSVIPIGGTYADQPYIVKTADGAWLCVVTTGLHEEGARGQHIVTLRSEDGGLSWSKPTPVEPPTGPEASWGVLLAAPGGRVFVFYVYNADDLRELPAGTGKTRRMDSQGYYVFRWSDDYGKSWSKQRGVVPIREFDIDRENTTGGTVRLFWSVARPLLLDRSVILTVHKVGGFGPGWFTRSEGALVRSDDLLSREDPTQASWTTLPEGDKGLRTPPRGGPIAEEQCLAKMSDGSLFAVYRSIDGYPVGAYSRDSGRHWEEPRYLSHQDGRRLKHPRAACFVWRLKSGGYVLWFHNHGGRFIGEHPKRAGMSYYDRNPAWMCRGYEIRTPHGLEIAWGEPEIALYDDDPSIRMSYPDLIEENGTLYLTETQKAVARVHKVDEKLAKALRQGPSAFPPDAIVGEAVLKWTPGDPAQPVLPAMPRFAGANKSSPYGTSDLRSGLSLELVLDLPLEAQGQRIFSTWSPTYGGMILDWEADRRLKLTLSDGRTEFSWHSDALPPESGGRHHCAVVVDGGPKIVSFLWDGRFCDGADQRQFGWGRFSPYYKGLLVSQPLQINPSGNVTLRNLRIYPRALLSAEVGALYSRFVELDSANSEPK